MRRKYILTLLATLLCGLPLTGTNRVNAQVQWHTIQQASEEKIGEKLYFIDFYTTWCGYCKKMDRETFSDATVAKLLNRYYYPVKFNAEGTETFTWFGRSYGPGVAQGRSRSHQFAAGLRGFPTFGIYRSDGRVVQQIPGYYPPKDFIMILWYFASGDYQRYAFEQYQKIFDKEIRPAMEKALE